MPRVGIVTDSCACVPEILMSELEIQWVPYYIHRGEETLRDLVTARGDEFYPWLGTADVLPTTAAPGVGDYLKIYQALISKGIREIASIHMTSKGSGAFQAAQTAKRMIRDQDPDINIEVLDTLNVSMCQGWMVIEAARAAWKGQTLQEVSRVVRRMIPRTRMIQTADTLRYLYIGGRIGMAKHLVGSLLNIKPLISMEDGIIVSLGQTRSRAKAYEKMVDLIEQAVTPGGGIKIAYVHAAARAQAENLRAMVESRLLVIESMIVELTPALGVHTGPGTVGLCYYPFETQD